MEVAPVIEPEEVDDTQRGECHEIVEAEVTTNEALALEPVAIRALGVLVEKQMTTPDAYPLSRGGVTAGCNQATNRDPVLSVGEDEVESALVVLHDLGLATPVRRAGDRVTKYRHKLGEAFEIPPPAQAVLAVLLLRGPQTGGELRSRTERYVAFESIEQVEVVIDDLEERGLARRMERLPGQSQRRVEHLVGGGVSEPVLVPRDEKAPAEDRGDERLSALEERFEELLRRLGVDDL